MFPLSCEACKYIDVVAFPSHNGRNWMAATLEPQSQGPPTSTCFSIHPQQVTDLLKHSSSLCFVGLFHAQKRVAPVNEQSWGHSLKNPVQPRCHCLKNRTPTKKTRNRMSTAKIKVKDLTQFQALGLSHTVKGLGFRVPGFGLRAWESESTVWGQSKAQP